ncbi:MAG: IPT/TIG domain-containing protein [Proteobacteria bacterium]|nr:IPT/TIG domain-containing protein [Pseudomonadota bacterium]
MKQYSFLLAAGLTLLVATETSAQNRPNEVVPIRVRPRIAVDDWYPKQGKVGTEITIVGKGFSPNTRVLVGGAPARVTQSRPDTLKFRMPRRYRDGSIALRDPRSRRDVAVGTFTVIQPTQIQRFAPQSGIPGTRVEIIGSGFRQGDQVFIGSTPLRVQRMTPRRIVAIIPPNARTDFLIVANSSGEQSRSARQFTVLAPNPVILAVEPASGFPGTVVRISGQNFGPRARVFYGKHRQLRPAGRGPGWIDVRIPPDARVSRWIFVESRSGRARSPQKFALTQPPVISRIAPTYGGVGQRVDVYGRNFLPGDRVKIAGVWAEILQLRPNRITVRIPAGARSGPIAVRRGKLKAISPEAFTVLYAPVIHNFSPAEGEPGTKVTISGDYFTPDARVNYGSFNLRVLQRQGNHTLVVRVPRQVTSQQPFTVRTRAGQTVSAKRFRAFVYPTIADMQPRQGYPGTQVTLFGSLLNRVDAVLLDNVPLTVISRKPKRLVAKIPPGAQDGWITLKFYGKTRRSEHRFQVLRGPEITGFYPQSARPGMEITVDGQRFNPATEIYLGRMPLPVVRRSGRQLVVRLPEDARPGQWYLFARRGPGESRSPRKFRVLPAAYISDFSPGRIAAGDTFVIRGGHFDGNTRIYWGNEEFKIISSAGNGRRLEVRAPRHVSGRRYLWVYDGGARHRSPAKLEIRQIRVRDHRKNRRGDDDDDDDDG